MTYGKELGDDALQTDLHKFVAENSPSSTFINHMTSRVEQKTPQSVRGPTTTYVAVLLAILSVNACFAQAVPAGPDEVGRLCYTRSPNGSCIDNLPDITCDASKCTIVYDCWICECYGQEPYEVCYERSTCTQAHGLTVEIDEIVLNHKCTQSATQLGDDMTVRFSFCHKLPKLCAYIDKCSPECVETDMGWECETTEFDRALGEEFDLSSNGLGCPEPFFAERLIPNLTPEEFALAARHATARLSDLQTP